MAYSTLESSRYSGKPVSLYLIQGVPTSDDDTPIGPFAYCNGEQNITRDGITYTPWPIQNSEPSQDGTLDKSDITVSLALGAPDALEDLFIAYPPSQTMNLTIFEGHVGDDVTVENFPATWMGRVTGVEWEDNELNLSCVPVSTSIKRPGLRRNYQLGCPHVLYGEQCRASKAAATVTRSVVSVSRNQITMDSSLGTNAADYIGGLLEWSNSDNGRKELRTISAASGAVITIRGLSRGLATGTTLSVVRGCNRQMSGCNSHGNILNFGGQPWIPLENPMSQKNQFY